MALTITDPRIVKVLSPKPTPKQDDFKPQLNAQTAQITALEAQVKRLAQALADTQQAATKPLPDPKLPLTAGIQRVANNRIKSFQLGYTLSVVDRDSEGKMTAIRIKEMKP